MRVIEAGYLRWSSYKSRRVGCGGGEGWGRGTEWSSYNARRVGGGGGGGVGGGVLVESEEGA